MTALYLERFLNYGLTRRELQSGRPIIGIAQTGSDLVPCNRHLVALAARVRDGIRDAGGIAFEFPVHPLQETGKRPTAALESGIAWLERHLETRGLRLHRIPSLCRQPMHIDSSFMPLAPGKVLINPEYVDIQRLPPILKRWDMLVAPRPDPVDDLMSKISMCSPWTSINVLMLDERRVVVDASQSTLQRALRSWGFDPIPVPFLAYGPFGGAFHCATLDIRRRGPLQEYFT